MTTLAMPEQNTNDEYVEPPVVSLSARVALFNNIADKHVQKQAVNPFSTNQSVGQMEKRRFSKEEYGRPEKGSKSESRAFKANLSLYRQMLELCEVINEHGRPFYNPSDKNEFRKVILFGELFNLYTLISDKLVGMLLRTRKYQLVDFQGECLFQRRDDDVPIILTKRIEEIRQIFKEKILETQRAIYETEPPLDIEEETETK